jgi:curved DNA-binding protein
MAFVDYYKVLGINKNASAKDIKNAYRNLARKFHPDLNPNDADAKKNFQGINEANEVLSDLEKRKKYDLYGENWEHGAEHENARNQQRQSSNSQGSRYGGNGHTEGDFSSFFESMFGGEANQRGRQAKYRGEDYNAELNLDLLGAYYSHQQTLTVNGKNIRITVPAGIENGQTIKIGGHGGQGVNGGPNGDLFIRFLVADQAQFKRLGNDIYTNVDLGLYTAVLGGEITIDTLDGKVKLNVKPETQNGSKVKLKGKGFPIYKQEGQFGDLYVTYTIKIPTNLTEKQKELFTELSTNSI